VQRGIEVGGVNTYEDSDMFVSPPEPLPNTTDARGAFDDSRGGSADDADAGGGADAGGAGETQVASDDAEAPESAAASGWVSSLLKAALDGAMGRRSKAAAAEKKRVQRQVRLLAIS